MEVGENRVYRLRYREKRVRRRETRDIYRRHQPRLQPAVSDPCIYVTIITSQGASDIRWRSVTKAKSFPQQPHYCIYRSQPEMSLVWPETEMSCMAGDGDVSYGRR